MNISIFGMGYVGAVNAACLASMGHKVIGVDVNPYKVKMIQEGKSPVMEPKLPELIEKQVRLNRLSATVDSEKAFSETEMSIICVGTPSKENGDIELKYVIRVFNEIGQLLKNKNSFHWIILRSTVLPGSTEGTLVPILEDISKKKAGTDFGICFNPEFLREGSSVDDFFNPPKTVIGTLYPDELPPLVEIYRSLPGPKIKTSIKVAELVKYIDNVFHALKICFANEVGRICKALNIDSHEVMNIFVKDTKLNISPAYLKPGYAFGGSCLPKDTRALNYMAKRLDVELPLIGSILRSNEVQFKEGLKLVLNTKKKKVGLIGLSFKEGTDDLRESPFVLLAEALLGKGINLKIYDPHVYLSNLHGTNKEFIEKTIPHLAELLTDDLDSFVLDSEVVVVGARIKEKDRFIKLLRPEHILIDLVRAFEKEENLVCNYYGIGW